jgi:hypothetical protein
MRSPKQKEVRHERTLHRFGCARELPMKNSFIAMIAAGIRAPKYSF